MRIVSRTTRSIADRQREQSLRRRAAAGSLAQSYPGLESIRIQLQFIPATGIAPAAQTHALYPSAPAYFEFPCPYGDCDGRYDLGKAALPLLRGSGRHAEGTLQCAGTRAAGGEARRPCRLRADFWMAATHQPVARASAAKSR
jgi:hypothetical protein